MTSALEQQYLLFRVGELQACFDLAETLSVINLPKMIRLQSARGSIIRAFRHQDELGALVSMRMKFGQEEQRDFTQGKLVLGRVHGRLVGFWVDELLGITRLSDQVQTEDEGMEKDFDAGAINRVVVYREQRYLHLVMQPFLLFENPRQLTEWLQRKQLEWHQRDLAQREAEEAKAREQQRQEQQKLREKEAEALQHRLETMYLDPAVTLEYALGLLDVAEYNEAQRLEEEAATQARETEAAELAAAEAPRAEEVAAIELPELGQIEEGGATPHIEAPDAMFEEEQPQPEKPRRRILWGARRKTGEQAAPRQFKNIKALRPGVAASLKRWGHRLVVVVVLVCVVLIFKAIEPGLYRQAVEGIQHAVGSLELGQTWDRLWHKMGG